MDVFPLGVTITELSEILAEVLEMMQFYSLFIKLHYLLWALQEEGICLSLTFDTCLFVLYAQHSKTLSWKKNWLWSMQCVTLSQSEDHQESARTCLLAWVVSVLHPHTPPPLFFFSSPFRKNFFQTHFSEFRGKI